MLALDTKKKKNNNNNNKVVGIEHIDSLVNQSMENLKNDGKTEMMKSGLITITKGDGRLGCEKFAPLRVDTRPAPPPGSASGTSLAASFTREDDYTSWRGI